MYLKIAVHKDRVMSPILTLCSTTLVFRHPSQLVSATFPSCSLQLLVSSCAKNYNTISTDKGIMVGAVRHSNAWFVFCYMSGMRQYSGII